MKLTELFLADLDREARPTRRTLERVPDGVHDWKPHPKSMPMGYLTTLVATMPSWLVMMVNQEELDLAPPGAPAYEAPQLRTSRELVEAFDANVASAREALLGVADEEHFMKPWRLLRGGVVLQEDPRHITIRDGFFQHLAHHRGQLTVYLRLNDAPVPSIYGPSADEAV